VYALLFRDSGVGPAAISSLLMIWSLTSFLAEVPSGAWADSVPRRLLLVASSGLYALGFALWTALPTYWSFAGGFVLWGISGALMSGTFEALLYDELAARVATDRYVAIMGWANALAMVAALLGTVLASPLYDLGGYPLIGWVSVGVAVLQGVLGWSLPSVPAAVSAAVDPADPDDGGADHGLDADGGGPDHGSWWQTYLAMVRAGLGEVTSIVAVRHAVLVAALLMGFLAYDEYFPLIAREQHMPTREIPLLAGLTVLGQVAGTALAGRTGRMRGATMGRALVVGAVLIASGVLVGRWAGFAMLGAGYGIAHNAIVVSEARLQDAMSGRARATVTSVAGLLSELFAVLLFGAFAVGSAWFSVSSILVATTVPLLAVAALVPRWLPASGTKMAHPDVSVLYTSTDPRCGSEEATDSGQ
jgi:MFS family permease